MKADQYESSEIVVRPKVTDDDLRKHIKFFDKFEHPKHIKQHECWVELKMMMSEIVLEINHLFRV